MKYSQKHYCRNCFYPLAYKARFCSHCGQKDTDGRVGIGELFQQMWFKAFHLESKYLRILWHLFIPGKVSQAYFQGKQKRYPPPVQFFFVIMFFFLFLFSRQFSEDSIKVDSPAGGSLTVDTTGEVKDRKMALTRLLHEVKTRQERHALASELYARYDSLPAAWRTEVTRQAVDSLFSKEIEGATAFSDTTTFSFFTDKYYFASDDIYRLTPDEMLEKYQVVGWWERMVVRQALKFMRDPLPMFHAYLGNFAWTIMALIAVMAGALSLLYRRQHRYYVEHFVFLLHQHSSLFWLLAVALLLERAGAMSLQMWVWVGVWAVVAPLLAMWRYYAQSFGRTLLKWFLFSGVYGIGFLIFFALGIGVVFLVF